MLTLKLLAAVWIFFIIILIIIFGNLMRWGTFEQSGTATLVAAWFGFITIVFPTTVLLLIGALVEYGISGEKKEK